MPKGSDESWVGKLNDKCGKYKHFGKARFGTACKYCQIYLLAAQNVSGLRKRSRVCANSYGVIPRITSNSTSTLQQRTSANPNKAFYIRTKQTTAR